MSTDKQVPLTIEDCRCIIEDSETERETRLARAHIELLAAHAKTQEQLEGALENASDIAVKLGVECDDMTDAQMWHASVRAIVKLQGQLADADFGYGGWNSIRTRIEAERDALREQLAQAQSIIDGVEYSIGGALHWNEEGKSKHLNSRVQYLCNFLLRTEGERNVLREQFAHALRDTERLKLALIFAQADLTTAILECDDHVPYWFNRADEIGKNIDAALRAKQEPPCWACEGTRLVSNPLCSAPQGSDCPYCRAEPKTSLDATQSADSIEGEGR